MKKTYSRKFVLEAIEFWKKQLKKTNESMMRLTASPRVACVARCEQPDKKDKEDSKKKTEQQQYASTMTSTKEFSAKLEALRKQYGVMPLVVVELQSNKPGGESTRLSINRYMRKLEDVNKKTAAFIEVSTGYYTLSLASFAKFVRQNCLDCDYIGFYIRPPGDISHAPLYMQIVDIVKSDKAMRSGHPIFAVKCCCKNIDGYQKDGIDPDIQFWTTEYDGAAGEPYNVFEMNVKHREMYHKAYKHSSDTCVKIDKSSYQNNYECGAQCDVDDQTISQLQAISQPMEFMVNSTHCLYDVTIEDVKLVSASFGWLVVLEARECGQSRDRHGNLVGAGKFQRKAMTGAQIAKAIQNCVARHRSGSLIACILRVWRSIGSYSIADIRNVSAIGVMRRDDVLDEHFGWYDDDEALERKADYAPTVQSKASNGDMLDDMVWTITADNINRDSQLLDMNVSGGTSVKKKSLVYEADND